MNLPKLQPKKRPACAGLYVSYHLNLPSGACMVGCLGSGFVLSLIVSPQHGMFGGLLRRRRHYAHDASDEVCAIPPLPPGAPP